MRSRDEAHYRDFARQVLATAPGIRSYISEIALDVPNRTTEIPVVKRHWPRRGQD